MPDQGDQPLRTLAEKVNWLIDRAHPPGRGPLTNAEVAELVHKTTGEQVSYTTIWKLRNGQADNPQKRLIEALAKTFGVPPGFFFDGFNEDQARLKEQVELLALIRDAGITTLQVRMLGELSPDAREAMVEMIRLAVRSDSDRRRQS